jgi:hypothetical protein
MRSQDNGTTVLLSDSERAASLAARIAPSGGPVAWYASIEDLVREQSLASVAVLVLHFHPVPKGILLAILGRMSVEYPGMQKLAVAEGPLPLPIAEYLTACGVDLLWKEPRDEKDLERLAQVTKRMHERMRWTTAPNPAEPAALRAAQETS